MRKIAPAPALSLATVLLAGLSFPPAASAQVPSPAPARATLCRTGPERSSVELDRMMVTSATCPYDEEGAAQRIEHLIAHSLKTRMEHTGLALDFGLPTMKTVRNERRMAAYATYAGGKDWTMLVTIGEAAFPLSDDKPAVFETTQPPRRLAELDQLDVEIELGIQIRDGASGPDRCLTAARLGAAATAAGWQDITSLSQGFVTDGGPGYPLYRGPEGRSLTFLLDRQAGGLPTPEELRTSCVTKVRIAIPANTPEGHASRGIDLP